MDKFDKFRKFMKTSVAHVHGNFTELSFSNGPIFVNTEIRYIIDKNYRLGPHHTIRFHYKELVTPRLARRRREKSLFVVVIKGI